MTPNCNTRNLLNQFCLEFPYVEADREEPVSLQEEQASQIGGNLETAKSAQDKEGNAGSTGGVTMVPAVTGPAEDLPTSTAAASNVTTASLTKENLESLDAMAAERKPDDDLSLIVHVDESQNDLDNDIMDTPSKSREGSQEVVAVVREAQSSSTPDSSQVATESTGKEGDVGKAEDIKKSEAPAPSTTVSNDSKPEQQTPPDQKAEDKKDNDQSKAARLVCICQSLSC